MWCVVSRRTGQSASRLFAQKATEYSLVGYAIGTCRRTGAPLHRHGNAWNFCAFGAKRWFLLPERAQHTNKPPRTRVSRDCLSQTLAGTAMAACVPCRLCASMAHPPRSQPMLCCAFCTGHVVCVCAPHRAGRVETHNTRVLRPHSAARCHALRERRLHRVASAACRTHPPPPPPPPVHPVALIGTSPAARPGRVCVFVFASARACDSRRRVARSERPTGCDACALVLSATITALSGDDQQAHLFPNK